MVDVGVRDDRIERLRRPAGGVDDVLGRGASGLKRDPIDRRVEPEPATEVFEQPDEPADQGAGAALGKEHAPLPFDPVDQRVDGARFQRVATDEQGVEAERLPEVLVFDEA